MKSDYLKIITNAFPQELMSDVSEIFKIIPLETKFKFDLISSDSYEVNIKGEKLKIPVRIYFNEPKKQNEELLTERQKDILNCLYTRHHDGYVREERLKNLSDKPKNWKTPFIIQLLGEYIYELFPIIDKKVNEETLEFYQEFRNKNPKYWQQTESRIASYWNEYYRFKFPKLKDYLGIEIINRIKKTNAQQWL
ncbi:hypothetical protein BWZ20_00070 [Winogradskyella sp. J14-2]|uniref:hypothetical protein n=1 Tax=Winogradskyella sp. J14-2 TaxID=1936080 RepID=UPI00097270AC|nr:hypothetical protein [Winogradskyella sp. J14-2]APY06789.1 hypothetical protein BWZ20_00070 [Winogradskyella sp. J14-2]